MAQSQNEEKNAWYAGFRNFKFGIMSELSTAYIAKVVRYDKSTHTADLLPLANGSDGQESAQYLDVPVAESCYILDEVLDRLKSEFDKVDHHKGISNITSKYPAKPLMRVGVPVVAVTLDRDNDNWDGGTNTYTPNSSRLHDANDAIVVAVLGGDAVDG